MNYEELLKRGPYELGAEEKKKIYADMLSEAAANSSMELTLESVGQYFFDNGYTAKRKYTKMPEILERAKKIREED